MERLASLPAALGRGLRALIEKESLAPPWRPLLAVYRRMELKGMFGEGALSLVSAVSNLLFQRQSTACGN